MALEGGLEKLKENVGSIFDRLYPECGVSLPDIPIGDFLRENEKACGLKPDSSLLKFGNKTFRDYCFKAASSINNGDKQKEELYEALKVYTKNRINTFKNKEEHKEELKITRDNLIEERNEILRFVRAREALKDNYGNKKFVQAVNEQKIRDAKIVKKLTGKT